MEYNDIHLTFIPEEIAHYGGLISIEAEKIKETAFDIYSKYDALLGTWEGESAELFKKRTGTSKTSCYSILRILAEYIADLQDVSGIYASGESAAATEAERLPTENVFLV